MKRLLAAALGGILIPLIWLCITPVLHWMFLGRDGDIIDVFGYPAPGIELLALLLPMIVNDLLVMISPLTLDHVLESQLFRDLFFVGVNFSLCATVTYGLLRKYGCLESGRLGK